jgi:ribonuclease Y
VLIDDTPGAVVLSGFDPVRREIAREAMQRLLLDGRIHPTRIEEVVTKVSRRSTKRLSGWEKKPGGKPASRRCILTSSNCSAACTSGTVFAERARSLDRSRAHHGLLAGELGLEVTPAKRAGLLHDIGKAVNHEVEGAHAGRR